MEKIYFENIQQTRQLDDEVAEIVKMFMSFRHFFDYHIVGSKSNLFCKKNGLIYTGTTYFYYILLFHYLFQFLIATIF